MTRVRLLADSYERYEKPGERRLVTLSHGDTFDAEGPELKRLLELGAVEKTLLTSAEAAEQTGLSVETIRRAVRDGSLTATRVGRTAHIAPTDLSAWLSARAAAAAR